jgi:hypothetical protein
MIVNHATRRIMLAFGNNTTIIKYPSCSLIYTGIMLIVQATGLIFASKARDNPESYFNSLVQ